MNPNLANESTSTAPSQVHSEMVSPDNRSHKDDKFRLKAVPQIGDQVRLSSHRLPCMHSIWARPRKLTNLRKRVTSISWISRNSGRISSRRALDR